MSAAARRAMIFALILMLAAAPAGAQPASLRNLSQPGLRIPPQQETQLASELGQLFIINVDGFDWSGPLALAPAFVELVTRLQIGGVIPHYASVDYERIRRTNSALSALTAAPLLICSDILSLRGKSRTGTFGDGYVGGFLGRFKAMPDAEFDTLAALNAFALAAAGINVALGPTVDTSTDDPRTVDRARLVIAELSRFGLTPVLKHFPFLPTTANLHHASPDMKLPLAEAEARFSVFRQLSTETGIMMTTHLYDSPVDGSLATFSPVWNALLRDTTGFQGLLMTDGLLMLRNYADRSVLAGGPSGPEIAGIDQTAVWAARAILAGHDFIIVEGSAAQTDRAFNGLLDTACRRTEIGALLRARIHESAARIARWKQEHRATLQRQVDVPVSAIDAVIDALPGAQADLATFRFDAKMMAAVAPVMSAAAVK